MEALHKILAWFMSAVLSFVGLTSFRPEERAQSLRVTAYLIVNKEVQRVSKEAMKDLDHKDIIIVFPENKPTNKTVRVLKSPKTDSSIRKVYLPKSVARMLEKHRQDQEEMIDLILFGDLAYIDQEENVILCENFERIMEKAKALTEGLDVRLHLNLGASVPDMRTLHKQAVHSGKLVKNIKAVLETYGLDGVQFDYEFPFEWQAKYWFSRFLEQLDKTLGDDYMIGCALQPWCARFLPGAIRAIDMVELMCYDNWNEAGYHAPMENAKRRAGHVEARLQAVTDRPGAPLLRAPHHGRSLLV